MSGLETLLAEKLGDQELDVDKLDCFVVLAEERHFGRAADRLGITTSGLSKRCAKLEQQMGVRLFERSSRQVRLTPAGHVLLDGARRVVRAIEAFETLVGEAARGHLGDLVIAYSPGNGELVGRVVRALRTANPEVEIRLEQRLSSEIGATVLAGDASLGVCRARVPAGLETLTVTQVMLDHLVMPAEHRLAGLIEIGPADLDGETLLASHFSDPALTLRADSWQAQGADVAVRYEHWVTESQIMDSVVAGFGLVALDKTFLERNPRPGLVSRPLAAVLVPEPIEDYLVWRADDASPVVRQFVILARSVLVTPDA